MIFLVQSLLAILLICTVNIFGDDIDEDYYFGVGLRTEKAKCTDKMYQVLCQLDCPKDNTCVMEDCVCINITPHGAYNHPVKTSKFVSKRSKFDEKTKPPGFIDFTKFEEQAEEYEKPVLRHHIAHFCPNLDVARECIKTCMVQGKPAFCGKDHVCYCGHSYNSAVKDDPVNAKAIYSQFQDMYKKYFGDKHRGSVFESEEQNTGQRDDLNLEIYSRN